MYGKILVPLDGSELSACALDHVRTIARGCSVPEVILMYVVEHFRSAAPMDTFPEDFRPAAEDRYADWAKTYLGKIEQELSQDGIAAKSVIMRGGSAADNIMEYAEKNGVDMIIMSTHGRSGPSRWAFGSVADRVSRHSQVPVLVVSPKECRVRV